MIGHRWDVSVKEATEIQKSLQSAVRLEKLPRTPRTIGGADISFARFSDRFFACVVVLSYPDLEQIEAGYFEMRVKFPYVPGYLSFREVPAIAEAYARLRTKPDVLMMDGQGIAHPRRLGVATHLGLVLERPVFGCAKSVLFGKSEELAHDKGSIAHLRDPKTREILGASVRTKDGVKPVIVSPGHRISLEDSIALAVGCVRKHRIPEPTRLAHDLVGAYRRQVLAQS